MTKRKNPVQKKKNPALTQKNLAVKLMAQAAAPAAITFPAGKHIVLHAGVGRLPGAEGVLPPPLRGENFHEIRMDITPETKPDVLVAWNQFTAIPDAVVDSIWCSHRLERLYYHQVQPYLKECFRVLKPGGRLLVIAGDLQKIAEQIYRHGMESNPVATVQGQPPSDLKSADMIFGVRKSVAEKPYIEHHCAFTGRYLASHLKNAGFVGVKVERDLPLARLQSAAYKPLPGRPMSPEPIVTHDDVNQMMVERDKIDKEPTQWSGYTPRKK